VTDTVTTNVELVGINRWTIARHIVTLMPLAVAGILTGLFTHYIPRHFLTGSNIANIGTQAAPLFIATIGQVFVMSVGGLDISVGGVAALSSMMMAFGMVRTNLVAGLLLGLVAGTLLGVTSGWITTRFRINSIIVTIAMLSSAQGFAFLINDGQPITGLPDSASWFAWGDVAGIPAPIIIAAGVFLVSHFILSRTSLGVKLRAVGEGYEISKLIGLRAPRVILFAFAASGFTAALASVIWTAQAGSGNQLVGTNLALETIAAAVIGGVGLGKGMGSAVGTIGGALVITILSVGMDLAGISPYTERIALGVALILIVMFNRLQNRLQILMEAAFSGKIRR